ncbi:MAG: hypothetical protein P8123_02820 [bacterium]
MKLLDLDSSTTWFELYNQFIENDVLWPRIKSLIASPDETIFNNYLAQFYYVNDHVTENEFVDLRLRCLTFVEGQYTHVAAYHACRPVDISTYTTRGICPSDTKVYLFVSRRGALVTEGLLKYGSELLSAIAGRIGQLAKDKLAMRGTPMLFQCAIPLNWLDTSEKLYYSVQPLAQVIHIKRLPDKKDIDCEGGFALTRGISPNLILEAIDMSGVC